MTKVAILNGRIIDPANGVDMISNLFIGEKKIIAINKLPPPDYQADITINAANMIVCPGLVDLNANILDSYGTSLSFNEAVKHAQAVGITSICTSTFSKNYCLTPLEIQQLSSLLQPTDPKIVFIGPLTKNLEGTALSELSALKDAGCIGFTQGYAPLVNNHIKRNCYDYAAMLGVKIFISPMDMSLAKEGFIHEGEVSMRLGIPGIPDIAETMALAQELVLVEATGVAAHFCRLSTGKSIEFLNKAKEKQLPVTSDVAIQQLFLTEIDLSDFNTSCYVQPPLRSETDRMMLRLALSNQIIDVISSNHSAIAKLQKNLPFQESTPGIASWPLLLPLTLRLVEESQISLSQALSYITNKPANILGIDAGHLLEGSRADICIFDPNENWSLNEKELLKFGSNTPFLNWQLRGRVKHTLIDGKIVHTSK